MTFSLAPFTVGGANSVLDVPASRTCSPCLVQTIQRLYELKVRGILLGDGGRGR